MGKIKQMALWARRHVPKVTIKQTAGALTALLLISGTSFYVSKAFEDPPIVAKSFSRLSVEAAPTDSLLSAVESLVTVEQTEEPKTSEGSGRNVKQEKPQASLYRSKQVFVNTSYRKDLPRLKLKVRLETPLDTRDLGASAEFVVTESDLKRIPKGTRVLCKASYPGSRSRVFFSVTELITREGELLKPMGRILSARDNLPGMRGKLHSGAFKKALKTVGLAVAGRGAEILASRMPADDSTEEILRDSAADAGTAAAEGLISDELSKKNTVFVTMVAGTSAVLSLP